MPAKETSVNLKFSTRFVVSFRDVKFALKWNTQI